MAAAIAREEATERQRSGGRIEGRRRFKNQSGNPLHEVRPTDWLFVDESGRSEPNYPESVFSLGAVSMSQRELDDYRLAADDIKRTFFGSTEITFHEPMMRRHEDWFSFGGDERRQAAFCEALDGLVAGTSFRAFGVAIRKDQLAAFAELSGDPYLPTDTYAIAIHMLMERYVDYLANPGERRLGRITFESQGPREDAEHQGDVTDLLLHGTQWVPDSSFRSWLETGIRYTRKQGTDPMELADMLSRDLFEWTRGGCGAVVPRRWSLFGRRVYWREDMRMGKFGIKVFPDSDIKDLTDAHRGAIKGS